ncbi:MAG: DUF3822 family protein [Bacteroidota bacterium]
MDESFDPEETHQYGLAIIFGDSDFSFCINDLKRGKYIGINHLFRNDAISGIGLSLEKPTFTEFLTELISQMPYLKNQYKLLKIAYQGAKTTLIPSQIFDPAETANYLDFSFGKNSETQVFSDHLMNLDAYQAFSIPTKTVQTVVNHFQKCRIVSSSSVFIESIWTNYKSRINAPKVFLNIYGKFIDIMIYNGHLMTYFNSFSHLCPQDITYYLIFVLEQLNLNPEQIPLVIFGDAEKDEELLDLLYNYIKHVEFGKRSAFFKYSFNMNEVPGHSYYPLLNFLSCGL